MEADWGELMRRMAHGFEQRFGVCDTHTGERMVVLAGYEERYGEPAIPTTDDPIEIAAIEALFARLMGPGCAPDRTTRPEMFWPMVRHLRLTERVRSSVETRQLPLAGIAP